MFSLAKITKIRLSSAIFSLVQHGIVQLCLVHPVLPGSIQFNFLCKILFSSRRCHISSFIETWVLAPREQAKHDINKEKLPEEET